MHKLTKLQIEKAKQQIEAYHQRELIELQKTIRTAFKQFDEGKINAFDIDHAIHEYHKQASDLFSLLNTYRGSNANLSKILRIITNENKVE